LVAAQQFDDVGVLVAHTHEIAKKVVGNREPLSILWKLLTDVRGPHEDGVQVHPFSLNFEPLVKTRVHSPQILLPQLHRFKEMIDKAIRQH